MIVIMLFPCPECPDDSSPLNGVGHGIRGLIWHEISCDPSRTSTVTGSALSADTKRLEPSQDGHCDNFHGIEGVCLCAATLRYTLHRISFPAPRRTGQSQDPIDRLANIVERFITISTERMDQMEQAILRSQERQDQVENRQAYNRMIRCGSSPTEELS